MIDLHLGDCLEVMRGMPDCCVDAVVTDPPYGIRFMGQAWDGEDIEARASDRRSAVSSDPQATDRGGHKSIAAEAGKYDLSPVGMLAFQQFSEDWARQAIRLLKPGGYLLSFASTRTYHRMVCGIEAAGFEIRDQIGWVFGSGFPKSHNGPWGGTALKPAWEPICVARKPLAGTVEANWREHGTGALNIDGCRIRTDESLRAGAGGTWDAMHRHGGRECEASAKRRYAESGGTDFAMEPGVRGGDPSGRWPANLIHDGSDEVVALFPREAGAAAPVTVRNADKLRNTFGAFAGSIDEQGSTFHGDSGSAAKFFAAFPQENEACPEQQSSAPIAALNSSLRSVLADSVQRAAAIWPSLAGILSSEQTGAFTSVTPNESKAISETAMQAMASIASGFLQESQHERRTPCSSLVRTAATQKPTGTTTITTSLYRSDGSVESATFNITPSNLDRGVQVSRFNYCAKASKRDRDEGLEGFAPAKTNDGRKVDADNAYQRGATLRANIHPTVKPTDLMRYLCRLVTPKGGIVLDPFMGSGSTGRGAVLEGLRFIGIEREDAYMQIARARIDSARRQGHQPDLLEQAA